MKYTTRTLIHNLCLLFCFITVTFAQQKEKYRLKSGANYLDVPVRSGYRIMANDNDGFLEDGIIVKTKGTGYIDSQFRKRQPSMNVQYQPSTPKQVYYNFNSYRPHEVASSVPYPRYASSEIIYGRRAW